MGDDDLHLSEKFELSNKEENFDENECWGKLVKYLIFLVSFPFFSFILATKAINTARKERKEGSDDAELEKMFPKVRRDLVAPQWAKWQYWNKR